MFCSNCGHQNLERAKFCAGCGAPFDEESLEAEERQEAASVKDPPISQPTPPAPPPREPDRAQPPPKKGSPWGLILGCGCVGLLLLLVLGGVGGWWYYNKHLKSSSSTASPSPVVSVSPGDEDTSTTTGTFESDKRFVKATLCKSVNENQEPGEVTDSFYPGDKFYCSVEITDVNPGDKIIAKWYKGEESLKEYALSIDTKEINFIGFSLSGKSPWPAGDDYKVEIYIDDKFVDEKHFNVVEETGGTPDITKTVSSSWKVYLSDAVMCKAVDEGQKPIDRTSTFDGGDTFYCSILTDKLPANTVIKTKWYHGDTFIDEGTVNAPEEEWTGYIGFYCSPKTSWPQGDYKCEIFFNDNLAEVKEFSVE